ncbi:hypothetical protein D3C76_836500 [compost metagenome]
MRGGQLVVRLTVTACNFIHCEIVTVLRNADVGGTQVGVTHTIIVGQAHNSLQVAVIRQVT